MTAIAGELPGFSRIICRDDVPVAGLNYTLTADPRVREILTKRFDLLSLDRFEAQVEILPWRKFGLRITCTFQAELTQACVVSLAPVPDTIQESFSLCFLPVKPTKEGEREVAVNPLEEEPPEVLEEEGFDLGEVIAEQLALVLKPYPRAPGAEISDDLQADVGSAEVSEKRPNPFEVLKNLKVDDTE
jgi:uncharacterized metal-binding protein YceD (DUF177 family)